MGSLAFKDGAMDFSQTAGSKRLFHLLFIAVLGALLGAGSVAQQDASTEGTTAQPGNNLVLENVPPIPAALAEATARYGEYRSATLFSWHPTKREMLIGTRFADVQQVHWLKMPGGARQQTTFFPDRILAAAFEPKTGKSFVFQKDVGGGEWYQLYRFDVPDGSVTLLTDGRSRNSSPVFAHNDDRIAYTSTRRDNQSTDIWVMNVEDPKTDHLLLRVEGGGWQPLGWSEDNKQLLALEQLSINQSNVWLIDVESGQKKLLTPRQEGPEQVSYTSAQFSKSGKGVYLTTDRDSEFLRLAYYDLDKGEWKYLTQSIPWDVAEFAISENGETIAFVTNENGIGKLYLLDTVTGRYRAVVGLPVGVISGVNFHKDSHEVGFGVSSARSPQDVYSVDTKTARIDRWTQSETGGLNTASFAEPTLVRWKSFDQRIISGYLYQPDRRKFPGKRPVMVIIHGGPEGQARPIYLARNNYFLNELGVAILYPNVRGSTGYGKDFTMLDNGFHRDDTYKDIGALLDWIDREPLLDASRIMVTGGSYGGHMTWAVAAYYNDRIRCALPVVGMSNLVTFLEHTESYRRDLRRIEYGDERDPQMRAYLEKIAPMNHLEGMHKPIFAVVGKNDPRVPWTESRQILDKLKAQGTPTWFLMANDEGHGYAKKKNQDFLFNAEVLFVKQYLLDSSGVEAAGN
jgi:dipeptidyl aminopeptidase/acylaminoacyl peptidase